MAEEVARMDAWAKLAEFVGGMEVNGVTSVKDMITVDQKLAGRLRARINNMSTQEMFYSENGIVQCKVVARLSDLVDSIESFITENRSSDAAKLRETFRRYNMRSDDRELVVWGNGALAGTEGVEIIQAIRAAELDALAQMVSMLIGVQIGRETSVRDLVLASDRIKACLEDSVQGVLFTDYAVLRNTVEVTAQVKFVTVIERLERVYVELVSTDLCTGCPVVEKTEFEQVTKSEESRVHEVVGKAARTNTLQTMPVNAAPQRTERKETIVEKVLRIGLGIE